jgi:hypothetical protein
MNEIVRNTIAVNGIPCTLAKPKGSRKPAEYAVLHCVRNRHTECQMRDALVEAAGKAVSVQVEWTDGEPEREHIGSRWKSGEVDGFKWECDWSAGCHIVVAIPETEWSRERECTAIKAVREFFRYQLKTEPDSVDVRKTSDDRRTVSEVADVQTAVRNGAEITGHASHCTD